MRIDWGARGESSEKMEHNRVRTTLLSQLTKVSCVYEEIKL